MSGLVLALRLMALSQVLLATLAASAAHTPRRVRTLWVLLGGGLGSYLIQPVVSQVGLGLLGLLPLVALSSAIPALLWLLSRELFEEARGLPWPALALTMVYVGLALADPARRTVSPATCSLGSSLLFVVVPQVAKLGFVVTTIVTTLRGRRIDLVEWRRSFRVPFVLSVAVVVSAVIITELWVSRQAPAAVELVSAAFMFAVAFATNLRLLRFSGGFLPQLARKPAAAAAEVDASAELVEILDRLMTRERIYRDDSLRIGALAKRLGVSEHALRRVINQGLGYRNFNRFLNTFRVREAAQRLREQPSMSVLTIALETGFRSLSSFNKAFRDEWGVSPTHYRTQVHTDGS